MSELFKKCGHSTGYASQYLCLVLRNAQQMLMILSFSHKGLQRFFEGGTVKGIRPEHAARLRMQLAALDTAHCIEDMDLPGYRLHPLKGSAKNRWAISVSANWRLTFEFRNGNVFVLDYLDYH